MKFALVTLVALFSLNASADKDSYAIFDALNVTANNITPANLQDVIYYKKAVGGLTCLRVLSLMAPPSDVPNYLNTNCALNIDDRRDQAIFEALNIEAVMNGRNRVTKTVGALSCSRSASDTVPGPAPFYHCSLQ